MSILTSSSSSKESLPWRLILSSDGIPSHFCFLCIRVVLESESGDPGSSTAELDLFLPGGLSLYGSDLSHSLAKIVAVWLMVLSTFDKF